MEQVEYGALFVAEQEKQAMNATERSAMNVHIAVDKGLPEQWSAAGAEEVEQKIDLCMYRRTTHIIVENANR